MSAMKGRPNHKKGLRSCRRLYHAETRPERSFACELLRNGLAGKTGMVQDVGVCEVMDWEVEHKVSMFASGRDDMVARFWKHFHCSVL